MSNIDALVEGLEPVRPVSARRGIGMTLLPFAAAIFMVGLQFGFRPDIMAGAPHPIVMIRGGMLLLLGFASLAAVVAAARPGVGQSSHGWRWALAGAALFPLTSLVLSIANGGFPADDMHSPNGPWCLKISVMSGLAIGGMLTLWLRTGAPTALDRTGWLVGLAAGAFGAFAYGLHCPSTTVYYVGLWYTAAVGLCAILGRLIVPSLIRW